MPEAAQPNRITLECIAGKDENRRILVDENPVRIAHESLQPALAITDIAPAQGFIVARADGGVIVVDAHNCLLPVYINNREIMTAPLHEDDVLRIGTSLWRTRSGATGDKGGKGGQGGQEAKAVQWQRYGFTELIGLGGLKDFRLGDIFSEVFKRHTQEEMEEQLITGTSRHTPALEELSVGWGRPWLFARLLVISALLTLVIYGGWDLFKNEYLIPGLLMMGSFAVPLSTLIFFLEMNVPRNVSIFKVMQLMFVGGIASIFLALIFFSKTAFLSSWLGASSAGIVEESAKLLIVAVLVGGSKKNRWVLNGLLFGAAVGTGFGAFESAGYALKSMVDPQYDQAGQIVSYIVNFDAGVYTIVFRAVLAPFMHIVWTANTAAALWLVKGDKPFSWDMLRAPAFLRVFLSSVLIHAIWNAPFSLVPLPFGFDLKEVILAVLSWIICFRLVQAGLNQLNTARQQLMSPPPATRATVRPSMLT
jgi:RsiW-degrading membrane proteinase PrsW (M82 family)